MEKVRNWDNSIYAYRIDFELVGRDDHPQLFFGLLKGNGLYEELTSFSWNNPGKIFIKYIFISTEELLMVPGKNCRPVLVKFMGKFDLSLEEESISKFGTLSIRKGWGYKDFFVNYKKQVNRLFERLGMKK